MKIDRGKLGQYWVNTAKFAATPAQQGNGFGPAGLLKHRPPTLPTNANGSLSPLRVAVVKSTQAELLRASRNKNIKGAVSPKRDEALDELADQRWLLAKEHFAIAEEDRASPLQANLTHARLHRATSLLLETKSSSPLPLEDASVLHALFLYGQLYNRSVYHNGMSTDRKLPFTYSLDHSRYTATTKPNIFSSGSREICATPAVVENIGVLAHESLHDLHNHPLELPFGIRLLRIHTSLCPRAGMAELAIRCGEHHFDLLDARKILPEIYHSLAYELQASGEVTALNDLLPASSLKASFSEDSGMGQLVPLLVDAGPIHRT